MFPLNSLYFIVLAEDDDGKAREVSTHASESCFQSAAGNEITRILLKFWAIYNGYLLILFSFAEQQREVIGEPIPSDAWHSSARK